MISCSADESGHILALSYSGRVTPSEMREALGTLRGLVPRLRPGFILFSDFTNLEADGARLRARARRDDGAVQRYGMANTIRVIADPGKDIGLNIISQFHFHHAVRVNNRENLAEALKCLLLTDPAGPVPTEPAAVARVDVPRFWVARTTCCPGAETDSSVEAQEVTRRFAPRGHP